MKSVVRPTRPWTDPVAQNTIPGLALLFTTVTVVNSDCAPGDAE